MIRFAIAQLVSERVRLLLTAVAVVLGVGFVTGSLVLNDTARQLFDAQFATASSGADVTVRTATAFDSGMGVDVERDPLPPSTIRKVREVDAVTAAIPVAKGEVRLELRGNDLGKLQLSTWVPQPVGSSPLLAGDAPAGDRDLALDKATAELLGLEIGDEVVVVGDARATLRIVGLVGFGESDGPPVGSLALTTLAGAQTVLGIGDGVSELLVTSELPATELQSLLAVTLGRGVQVATAQDLATSGAEQAAARLEMLQVVLVAMSVATLAMGAFLISNTFSIVVSQRTRELAVVRAAGATGRQLARSILLEALVVGVIASAAGVALGVLGAYGLRFAARASGVTIPEGDLVVLPRTLVAAVVIGVVVTVASAIAPAHRAATVSPLAAMRTNAAEPARVGATRLATGAIALAVGVIAAILPSFGFPIPLLGAGLILGLIGIVRVGPFVLRPLIAASAVVTDRTVAGRLAREAAARAPRRTSATVMALAFGLALMTFVSVVGESVKAATGEQYREVITADVVIESAGQEMLGGVHATVFDEVRSVPGVGAATRLKYGHWKDESIISALTGLDPHGITDVARIDMVDGDLTALDAGGVVIASRVATERGLEVGDDFTMTFARTGTQSLPVVGIIADGSAQALQTDFFLSLESYAQHFTEDMDASIFVTAAPGTTPDALTEALATELVDHPTVQVRDQAAVIAGRTQTVDQIFGLVGVLLAFAMLIAALGVANTLALSIVERTREFGLLRSLGMTRGSIGLLVAAEAGIIALCAVVLGLLVGAGASLATVGALSTIAPLAPVVPAAQLLTVALIVAAVGLLAGLPAARRAAQLPVLAAIARA